jgi:hypothetical protein
MTVDELRSQKAAERAAAIDRLVEEAKQEGGTGIASRAYWTMLYDFEMAPMTTNRQQLESLGIDMPNRDGLSEGEMIEILKRVLGGLASLSIYVTGDDALNTEQLYAAIYNRIDQKVRDLPSDPGVRVCIDCASMGYDPDRGYIRDWIPVPPGCEEELND